MCKINNSYDTLWTKMYLHGNSPTIGFKTIETYDSSIISIGQTYIGTAFDKQDWYIVKTDSLGNLDWWLHPGNPTLNDGAAQDIIQTRDSCFIVVGGKAVYKDPNTTKFDGRIMKLDINGNILWDKTYRKHLYNNNDTVYCFFKSIIELDDGGFMVLASEQLDDGIGHEYNRMYKFNSVGDTIWSAGYSTYLHYSGNNYTSEILTTIQKTNNGGFLLGGWGWFGGVVNHQYFQQMILIKTDSLGCANTPFSCTVSRIPSIVREKEEEELVVYPNPVKESLTLALSKGEGIKAVQNVFIYDVYGMLVKQKTYVIASQSEAISINLSNLEKGIYFVKIGENIAKFVKE